MKIDRVSPLFRGIGIGPMTIPFLSLRGMGLDIGLIHFFLVEGWGQA
jgi:hypothetical protein